MRQHRSVRREGKAAVTIGLARGRPGPVISVARVRDLFRRPTSSPHRGPNARNHGVDCSGLDDVPERSRSRGLHPTSPAGFSQGRPSVGPAGWSGTGLAWGGRGPAWGEPGPAWGGPGLAWGGPGPASCGHDGCFSWKPVAKPVWEGCIDWPDRVRPVFEECAPILADPSTRAGSSGFDSGGTSRGGSISDSCSRRSGDGGSASTRASRPKGRSSWKDRRSTDG